MVTFRPPAPADQPGFYWADERQDQIRRLREPDVLRDRLELFAVSLPDRAPSKPVLHAAQPITFYPSWYGDRATHEIVIGVETDEEAKAIESLNTVLSLPTAIQQRAAELFYGTPEVSVRRIVRLTVPRPFCHGSELWHYEKQPNIHRCPECLASRQSSKHDRGETHSPEYRRTPSGNKRHRVMERHDYKCVICGARRSSNTTLHMGHCISVADGRTRNIDPELLNIDENYVPMCAACNSEQGARSLTPDEYLALAVPASVATIYQTLKDIHGTA